MPRLLDPQKQIPNGMFYYEPATKWKSQPGSLDSITNQLIAHRKGNPELARKFNWSTDYSTVYNEVEQFQVRICQQMGWNQYLSGEGGGQSSPLPFPWFRTIQLLRRLAAVAVGDD